MKTLLGRIAISLWFLLGSLAITLALFLFAGEISPAAAGKSTFSMTSALEFCAVGFLVGLVADALRYLATLIWPERLASPFRLEDILNRHLA